MKFDSCGHDAEGGTIAITEPSKKVEKMTVIVKPVVNIEKQKEKEDMPSKGGNHSVVESKSPKVANFKTADRTATSDVDDGTGNGETDTELSKTLSNCSISDADDLSIDKDLSEKITNLQLGENKESGENIQEALLERGPTGGRPANYCPNVPRYNHIAAKNYPCPMFQPANNYYDNMVQMQTSPMYPQQMNSNYQFQNSGKRSHDYDEQPFKFTRPGEPTNNLNDPTKVQNTNITYSKVSTKSCSGGQVTVKSPEAELPMPTWHANNTTGCESTTSGEYDFMKLLSMNETSVGYPNMQQPANMNFLGTHDSFIDKTQVNLPSVIDKWQGGNAKRTNFSEGDATSEGYCSDVPSPYSETQDSEHNLYSPPPSNSSADSGYIPTVPSPVGSHIDAGSPNSGLNGFEQNLDLFDANMFSPPPVACPNTFNEQIQEFPPNLNFQNFSNLSPETPQFSSNTKTEVANYSDHSVFIDENLVNLKDVMDTIADDMQEQQKKQQKGKLASKCVPEAPPSQAQPVMQQSPAVIQQSPPVMQQSPPVMQQSQRVGKNIPTASVPPNPATFVPGPPATSGSVMIMNQRPNAVTVPISVAPNVVNSNSGKQIAATPVSTGQIVIIQAPPQPQPQPRPAIFVVTQPPQQKVPQQTKYKPIRPRIQPNPAPSKDATPVNKNIPVTVAAKATVPQKPVTKPTSMVAPVMAQSQKRPQVPQQQNPKCVNQLNIARRLVATMKTDDLEDKDKEGDTYLHIAVCRADKFMVQALLERIEREKLHSMIDTQNHERQTPVYLAVSANQPDMVSMLIKYGADVNQLAERVSPNGQREVKAAIHCAVAYGKEYLSTLQALMMAPDLNVDMFNSDGLTALHCAILEHNQPRQYEVEEEGKIRKVMGVPIDSRLIIEVLVKGGADLNAQDKKSGKTAFMYAFETRDYSLVETLIRLADPVKIRSYFRSQAFDGTTCVKIMESRKSEIPPTLYEKLMMMLSNSRSLYSHR